MLIDAFNNDLLSFCCSIKSQFRQALDNFWGQWYPYPQEGEFCVILRQKGEF